MKKAEIKMSLLMGLSMSFVLSLVGMMSAGQFTVPGFLRSFLISFAISMILGLIIPVRRISTAILIKTGIKPGTLKANLLEALVSDLAYSPIMTFIMEEPKVAIASSASCARISGLFLLEISSTRRLILCSFSTCEQIFSA